MVFVGGKALVWLFWLQAKLDTSSMKYPVIRKKWLADKHDCSDLGILQKLFWKWSDPVTSGKMTDGICCKLED